MFDQEPLVDPARNSALAAIKDVLRETNADHAYDVIRRTDTDEHSDLIRWMVSRKECDHAVALYALLVSDLPMVLRRGGSIDDCGPVAHTILTNWMAGKYRTSTIDATPDLRYIIRMLEDSLKRTAPTRDTVALTEMLALTGERRHDLPEHLSPETCADLWAIYNTLGLDVGRPPAGRGGMLRDFGQRLVASLAQNLPRPATALPAFAR